MHYTLSLEHPSEEEQGRPSSPPLLLVDAVCFQQSWTPSVGIHWHLFTKRQTWKFSHPENAAAAHDIGVTSYTSSGVELKMGSNSTEKKSSEDESHCTPRSPALPCPCIHEHTKQPSHDITYMLEAEELTKQAEAGCAEPACAAAPACGELKVPSPSAKHGLNHFDLSPVLCQEHL